MNFLTSSRAGAVFLALFACILAPVHAADDAQEPPVTQQAVAAQDPEDLNAAGQDQTDPETAAQDQPAVEAAPQDHPSPEVAADQGHATPDSAPGSDAADPATIISIDSAPETSAPLVKAIDNQGDPQRDLWERIRVGFSLPELNSPLVAENEAWYTERPEYVARMLDRSKRYLYFIVEEVEKRGMPTEIALLPMIESAFNPKAYSRSRAAGIWQFMPSTGRTFGLQQNWWVDDRRDIMAATDAALNYLQKLHEMFGDWDLALAAYNCGEGAVSRAIARNEAKGLPTDYLSLRLPNETRNYVPRLLAVKHMILHPQDFNASLGTLPNQPYFAQITTTQHIDVALAAKLGEISMDEFVSLNPHYNRPIISAKEPATILLPVDKADVFARNLEAYKKPLVSWQPYHGKRGERLDSIARRFKISTPRLKEANGIAAKSRRLAKNETLLVPGSASEATLDSTHFTNIKADSDVALAGGHYTVRHGDTLGSIARKHHVTIAQLKAWNGLKSQRIALNQKLAISLPTTHSAERATSHRLRVAKNESRKAAKPRRYTVRRGDTLYGIAQRFDVDLDDLRRWNRLSHKARLRPGDHVTIRLASNS